MFSQSYSDFLQKYLASKFAVSRLESSLLQYYAEDSSKNLFSSFSKDFNFSFDIFVSLYCMNIISLLMNKTMLGHHSWCQERCVTTISHRSAAIWSKSFDSKSVEIRNSKFWRILEILLSCIFDSKFTIQQPFELP